MSAPFQFPVPKPRATGLRGEAFNPYQPQGVVSTGPKPSYENNFMWALMQAGWRLDQIGYQQSIDGGRASRNGLVIDFILYTPSPIPIQVGATWWHRDSGEETLEDARIQNAIGRAPLKCFDVDCDTREHALAWVLREIGRA